MRKQWTLSALATVACAAAVHLSPFEAQTQTVPCFVSTEKGDVQGLDRGASCAFLGIPYAASTAGAKRWRPPQPRAPWAPSVISATTPPVSCPLIGGTGAPAGSEDCLKLNIWVTDPPPSSPAPVIVWLHTGAFAAASNNFSSHNGQRLAEETGAIVVAPNYRLGPFGFLAHSALAAEDPTHASSGNYGLLDQRAALVWVRDNIAQFGGDPHNVTLAGTSAGGQSVGLHLVSPGSEGFFHHAIVESAYPTTRWTTHNEALAQGTRLPPRSAARILHRFSRACARRRAIRCSRRWRKPRSRSSSRRIGSSGNPVGDGLELPDQPRTLFEQGAFHHVPTIIGATRDEGWGFVTRSFPAGVTLAQYEAWVATEFGADAPRVLDAYPAASFPSPQEATARVVGDGQFVCEARRLARLITETKTPTFLYSYEYEIDDLSVDHVIHGVESNIVFGNDYVRPIVASHALDAADLTLHGAMAGYWIRFATTGNPNTDDADVVHWPAFKHPPGNGRGSDKYIVLDSTIRNDKRLREEQCDFWKPFSFGSMLGELPASTGTTR